MHLLLVLLAWTQISIRQAQSTDITSLNTPKSHLAIWNNDSLYIYAITPYHDTLLSFATSDTIGIFAVSSFDSMTILIRKTSSNSLTITRFINLAEDTSYTLYTPCECNSLLLYNDGYIHPTFPVWFAICLGDSGLFITHSSNLGSSFYPFDTIKTDTGILNYDFTTSVTPLGDRLHIVYSTKNNNGNTLYLINGSYPANFETPVLIDSMIPDSGHFTVFAKSDTVFVTYERISSYSFPDPDIYYATSFHEGDTWEKGIVSATTSSEICPVMVTSKDTLKVYYLNNVGQNTYQIYECLFISPYTNHISPNFIVEGNYVHIKSDKTSSFPAILSEGYDGSTYYIYDETYTNIREKQRHTHTFKKTHGTFTIDGRYIKDRSHTGLYFKDGKKVLIYK